VQVLLLGRDVNEEYMRNAMLKVVSNEQAIQVLEHTIDSPKSAYDISIACKIPLTQVYRWVRKLHKLGFVRVSGATNPAGKKYFMYQSKIRTIKVTLGENSNPKIEIS
jgi:predicted transcriptional regulator